jgi:hypothetical protein
MARGIAVKIPKGKGDRGWGGLDGIVLGTHERFEGMYSVQIVRADFHDRTEGRYDDILRFALEESVFVDMDEETLADLYEGRQLVIDNLKGNNDDH